MESLGSHHCGINKEAAEYLPLRSWRLFDHSSNGWSDVDPPRLGDGDVYPMSEIERIRAHRVHLHKATCGTISSVIDMLLAVTEIHTRGGNLEAIELFHGSVAPAVRR